MFAIEFRGAAWEKHHIELDTEDGTHQVVYVHPTDDEVAVIVWDRPGDAIRAQYLRGDFDPRTHVVIDEVP